VSTGNFRPTTPPPPPPAPVPQFRLYCALCLVVRPGLVGKADTVVEGIAVCHDHIRCIDSTVFSNAVRLAGMYEATKQPKSAP
jgi:hypothetical protein